MSKKHAVWVHLSLTLFCPHVLCSAHNTVCGRMISCCLVLCGHAVTALIGCVFVLCIFLAHGLWLCSLALFSWFFVFFFFCVAWWQKTKQENMVSEHIFFSCEHMACHVCLYMPCALLSIVWTLPILLSDYWFGSSWQDKTLSVTRTLTETHSTPVNEQTL